MSTWFFQLDPPLQFIVVIAAVAFAFAVLGVVYNLIEQIIQRCKSSGSCGRSCKCDRSRNGRSSSSDT